jgi:hypothetical protein
MADHEAVACAAAFEGREMTEDDGGYDEMKCEGKTRRGGNPSPRGPPIPAQLWHLRTPASLSLALRRGKLKTDCCSRPPD